MVANFASSGRMSVPAMLTGTPTRAPLDGRGQRRIGDPGEFAAAGRPIADELTVMVQEGEAKRQRLPTVESVER